MLSIIVYSDDAEHRKVCIASQQKLQFFLFLSLALLDGKAADQRDLKSPLAL